MDKNMNIDIIKAAADRLVKQAEEEETKKKKKHSGKKDTPESKDVMQDSSGSAVAEYLFGPTFGADRAGRASQLGRAAGHDVGFFADWPFASSAVGTLTGLGIGGVAGTGIGAAIGGREAGLPSSLIGGIAGAGLGGLGSFLLSTYLRRRQAEDAVKAYDAAREAGQLDIAGSRPEERGHAMNILFGPGGQHHEARVRAYEALLKNKQIADKPGWLTATNVGTAISNVIPYGSLVASPAILAGNIASGYSGDNRLTQLK